MRASDDFYPRRPYSHSTHIINVAYNSLFVGEEGQLFSCGTELSPDGSRVRGLLGHGGLVGSVPIAAVPESRSARTSSSRGTSH